MSGVTPMIAMRGFTAAIGHAADDIPSQASGIAVGSTGEGQDRRYALAMRHADGTVLTAYLTDGGVDRLAGLLAELIEADMPLAIGAAVTIQ